MIHRVSKLLFPSDKNLARQRKLRILCVTVLGGLAASTLIALLLIWAHTSGRF